MDRVISLISRTINSLSRDWNIRGWYLKTFALRCYHKKPHGMSSKISEIERSETECWKKNYFAVCELLQIRRRNVVKNASYNPEPLYFVDSKQKFSAMQLNNFLDLFSICSFDEGRRLCQLKKNYDLLFALENKSAFLGLQFMQNYRHKSLSFIYLFVKYWKTTLKVFQYY